MTYGIIGIDFMREPDLHALSRVRHARLVAVSPQTHEKAATVAEGLNIGAEVCECTEILQRKDIDFVDIRCRCPELVISAVQAGKHVLYPMPIATSYEQSLRLVVMAEKNGVKCAAYHELRPSPTEHATRLIQSQGEIGDVCGYQSMTFDDGITIGTGEDGSRQTKYSCSLVSSLDLAISRFGIVEALSADGPDDVVPVVFSVRFKKSRVAHFLHSERTPDGNGRSHVVILGSTGFIDIDVNNPERIWVRQGEKLQEHRVARYCDMTSEYDTPQNLSPHFLAFRELVGSIINGRRPMVGPWDELKCHAILDAVYHSSPELDLPLTAGKLPKDLAMIQSLEAIRNTSERNWRVFVDRMWNCKAEVEIAKQEHMRDADVSRMVFENVQTGYGLLDRSQ